VCLFLSARGEVLHVLKSSDMRARVRGYFAVSETRPHICELLEHTERLCSLTRPTALAADVEEIRAIARHRPRFNDEPSAPDALPEVPSGVAGSVAPEISALTGARHVVAAGPRFDGGWDVAVIENGLLSAATALPPGTDPAPAAGGAPATGAWPAGAAAALLPHRLRRRLAQPVLRRRLAGVLAVLAHPGGQVSDLRPELL
jgi:hypothetical protein